MKLNTVLVVSVLAATMSACGGGADSKTNTNNTPPPSNEIFSTLDGTSHNAGTNCGGCHSGAGPSSKVWTMAGTVYGADMMTVKPNATVFLYTQNNGQGNLVLSVDVDKSGNFYTTEAINWGTGLYAVVKGDSTTMEYMDTPITMNVANGGSCNSCHNGQVTLRITAN